MMIGNVCNFNKYDSLQFLLLLNNIGPPKFFTFMDKDAFEC